ncbi:MAG: glycosyl transferase, UDP-glucuronosyltransferase [Myxacorys chilensis ATA2-1-KO14]|jgi:MGT family glycosyltransferase|nr:glycosyl transferase, UDP-glucuronosyltransferase [Myxacorys chilensis ATA2-1-KO14]
MARFLIGTVPVIGHVSPAVPIVRELVKRGHEVCWYTGQAFQSTVEKTGARFAPILSWLDYSDAKNVPSSLMEQREAAQGVQRLKFDLKNFFIDPALGQTKDLSEILDQFPADVLIADSMFLGVSWVAEQKGLPWAEFGASALALNSRDTAPFGLGLLPSNHPFRRLRNQGLKCFFEQKVLRHLRTYTNDLRSQLNLPACPVHYFEKISPFLYLSPSVPDFEYPRRDLPPQVHFTGALLSPPPSEFTPPVWWDELAGNTPIIHVTQGTVTTNSAELLVPTLQALEHEDVLVVATTGGAPVDTLNLTHIPANARIEPFIPHAHLLPHVDVMITNGGYNGVQMALANGVPLVVAGKTEEKPEVAARVEWAKVGINLRTRTPSPKQIKNAVKTLLKDSSYRTHSEQFQTKMQQYNAPAIAATLLEQLATTKQPVLR